MIDGRPMALSVAINARVLDLPGIAMPVVQETREVIAAVQVLQDAGEDLGLLVRQLEGLGEEAQWRERGARASCGEVRRDAEDLFVGGEEALFGADGDGYDVWAGGPSWKPV